MPEGVSFHKAFIMKFFFLVENPLFNIVFVKNFAYLLYISKNSLILFIIMIYDVINVALFHI